MSVEIGHWKSMRGILGRMVHESGFPEVADMYGLLFEVLSNEGAESEFSQIDWGPFS